MTVEEQKASYGFRPSFIGKVRLKGYKSIIDSEIEFKQGLNIIIGPNGSGKTNLLDFLVDLETPSKIKTPHSCEINYYDWEGKSWFYSKEAEQQIISAKTNKPVHQIKETLKEGQEYLAKDIKLNLDENKTPYYWIKLKTILNFTKIDFNLPQNLIGLDQPFQSKILFDNEEVLSGSAEFSLDGANFRIFDLVNESINFLIRNFKIVEKENLLSETLLTEVPFQGNIIENLRKYTPINNVKIHEDVFVKIEKKEKHSNLEIKYLRFSFSVDGEWLSWDMLSDGTKRLFYIILLLSTTEPYAKYLIEEPELGIHPHQLSLLMTFLKEKSEDNQIIITTHSPQVLNILDMDELDRIIITKNEKKKGTTLRNLSDRELKKAKSFMEEDGLSLSDYWIHSDLEEQML